MDFHYECDDDKLKVLIEKKAEELQMSPDRLVWNYIHRELMEDNIPDDDFNWLHSAEFLKEVDEALGLD